MIRMQYFPEALGWGYTDLFRGTDFIDINKTIEELEETMDSHYF